MTKKHDGPNDPGAYEPGAGGPDHGEPEGVDEEALRRLLHSAVDDVEPAPGALDHLRQAVPARRARKRQALVGVAAAVLLVGTAVPALVHVAESGGVLADRPANAGHSERAQGGAWGGAETQGQSGTLESRPPPAADNGRKGGERRSKNSKSAEPGSSSGGVDPTETMAATSPTCTRDQLSTGTASPGPLDGTNTVYGSFRVANTSKAACTIDGGGLVVAAAQGSADSEQVKVVDHTAGDPASKLPDPAATPQTVILEPGAAYEIKFAWIPSESGSGGCPKPGASPDPGGSGSTGNSGSSSDADGAESSSQTSGDGSAPQTTGSVQLSHTPQAGEPAAASATISNACAGTVYRTGALKTP